MTVSEGTIEPIFVSVEDAAKALGISKWSCYKLCDEERIETRYQGRRRLVVVDSLRRYATTLPTERPKAGDVA